MQEELFKPSLSYDSEKMETKTYDIRKILYVAFFGGVIPTVALGTKNSKWLGINKKIVYALICAGVLILATKMVVVSMFYSKFINVDRRVINLGYKGLSLLLYLAYYRCFKLSFNKHTFLGGETTPILKDAIIWILIGIVTEAALLYFVGVMFR